MDTTTTTRSTPLSWTAGAHLHATGLTILWHPDPGRVGERAPLGGVDSGRAEPLSRIEPEFGPPGCSMLRPLGDSHISRQPVLFAPGSEPGSVRLTASGSRTRVVAAGQVVDGERELSAADVDRGVVLLLSDRIVLLLHRYDPLAALDLPSFGLVGESAALVRLRLEIERVAGLDVPVLLRGESGTGKELVARAIHAAGARRTRPYLAVNLGAIPHTLATTELFGAARGAFTGADRSRPGYFVQAQGGTLFLDEIGEAPSEVQVLLLRVFETGEIQPVGGAQPVQVDVRLIAATDANLKAAAEQGRFKAPLLHRLGGYTIDLPPLRERREDFGRLFVHFLRQELELLGEAAQLDAAGDGRTPWPPARLAARLADHHWPGNVRQLRNVARRLAIAGHDPGSLAAEAQIERLLGDEPAGAAPATGDTGAGATPRPRQVYRSPKDVGDGELLEVLRANGWRLRPTAIQLGISRTSLYDLIDRSHVIRKARDVSPDEIETSARRCHGDIDAMVTHLEVSKKGLARRMRELGLL